MSEERFDRVEKRLDRLEAGQARLEERIETVDRHMHVLHEDVIARIAGLREFDGPSRSEFKEALADLDERIGRRFDPLIAIARDHEERINRLEKRRA